MTVFLKEHGLAYIAVPKVACTSVKRAFFEVENGRPFEAFKANGRDFHIHRLYKTREFDTLPHAQIAEYHRITILRDPVERFLSAYTNRVHRHGALSWWRASAGLQREGLAPDPDFGGFLWGIEKYRRISPDIHHHTQPLVDFLGHDPAYFHRIYKWSELNEFIADVAEKTGKPFVLGHHQTSEKKLRVSDISSEQVEQIRELFAQDYETFGNWL